MVDKVECGGRDSLHDDDGGHSLHDGHGTGQDARIVTALGGEDALGPVVLDGALFLCDRRRGLEPDPVKETGGAAECGSVGRA
jgi:hypothetical protein